ncbi:maleylpyruvate isomerase family mycothiol-dependent enzyme [Nocardia sp. NBC_01329]|uniref:maleylpyruvate isomerase family mycothiol-dependent enzyme n=1 Tax=Nocardia sp. NBC_01329 TaxID=2903594 RepID=UPI002E164534|nr:maleylpyruvate isomerase family mycothiol-dependent enzyme [Nocardia sp. NBC_01329]
MGTDIVAEELVWAAVAAERASLAEMLEGLTEQQWDEQSWCAGWRIRDVVGHILLTSRAKLGQVLWELLRARGNLDRMSFATAVRYADRATSATLLAELRAIVDLRHAPVGTTALDRLMDLLVHGQDIAVPLGLRREMPVAAARWSVERVWRMGAPFHAQRALTGHRLVATDTEWSAGSGAPVAAPIAELLLMVTGRVPVEAARRT